MVIFKFFLKIIESILGMVCKTNANLVGSEFNDSNRLYMDSYYVICYNLAWLIKWLKQFQKFYFWFWQSLYFAIKR